MDKKKIILFIPYLIIGIIFSLLFIGDHKEEKNNYILLIPFIILFIGILPLIFPFLKKYKFGTLDFYPTIFRKIFKK